MRGRDMKEVEQDLVLPFDAQAGKLARWFAFTALGVGVVLIVLICYSML